MTIYKSQYELLIGDPYSISAEEVVNGPKVPAPSKLKAVEDSLRDADKRRKGFKLTNHQISFVITKSKSGTSPNKMTLFIKNLPDDVVNYLSNRAGKKTMLLLKAGFETTGMGLIFVGNVESYVDNHSSPTRETKLTLADGGVNFQEAATYRHYPAGTAVDTIVGDLISDSFLPKGGANVYKTGEVTIKPLYFNGSVISQLAKLANMYKFNFSIQDGTCFWTPIGKAQDRTVALISSNTGLIGSVTSLDKTQGVSQNNSAGSNRGIKFKTLLNHNLLPETVVKVESEAYTGAYKVAKVVHRGSFEGTDWTSEVEAEEVQLYER